MPEEKKKKVFVGNTPADHAISDAQWYASNLGLRSNGYEIIKGEGPNGLTAVWIEYDPNDCK